MGKKNSSKNNSGNNSSPAPLNTNQNTNNNNNLNENINKAPIVDTEIIQLYDNSADLRNLKIIENQLEVYQSEFENNFHGIFDNLSKELNEIYQKFTAISNLLFDQAKENLNHRFDKIKSSKLKRDEMKCALLKFKEAIDSSFKKLDN